MADVLEMIDEVKRELRNEFLQKPEFESLVTRFKDFENDFDQFEIKFKIEGKKNKEAQELMQSNIDD